MKIAVIGTGYVGLVTAAGLAEFGHTVIGTDKDAAKIELISRGTSPIYEPGLDDLLKRTLDEREPFVHRRRRRGHPRGRASSSSASGRPRTRTAARTCPRSKASPARSPGTSTATRSSSRRARSRSRPRNGSSGSSASTGRATSPSTSPPTPSSCGRGRRSRISSSRTGSSSASRRDRARDIAGPDLREVPGPGPGHQHRHRRAHQARLELVPRPQDLLHQHDRRPLRQDRRRRRAGRPGHGPRSADRAPVPQGGPGLRRLLLPQGHPGPDEDRRGPGGRLRPAPGDRQGQPGADRGCSWTRSRRPSGSSRARGSPSSAWRSSPRPTTSARPRASASSGSSSGKAPGSGSTIPRPLDNMKEVFPPSAAVAYCKDPLRSRRGGERPPRRHRMGGVPVARPGPGPGADGQSHHRRRPEHVRPRRRPRAGVRVLFGRPQVANPEILSLRSLIRA